MQTKPPVLITYWIGEEPIPPSPSLSSIPSYVHIIPLAFLTITPDLTTLDISFLTKRFPQSQIKSWIQDLHARNPDTKILFSINDPKLGSIPSSRIPTFVSNVATLMAEWCVDGIDFDFEPPYASDTLIPLIIALRTALTSKSSTGTSREIIFTAPVYAKWLFSPGTQLLLSRLAPVTDYITTMDYTPYRGLLATQILCRQYAVLLGGWSQLCIGVSCMEKDKQNFTPLRDVQELAGWEDGRGREGMKAGMMVYNFSYDIRERTGFEDGAWTRAAFEGMIKGRREG